MMHKVGCGGACWHSCSGSELMFADAVAWRTGNGELNHQNDIENDVADSVHRQKVTVADRCARHATDTIVGVTTMQGGTRSGNSPCDGITRCTTLAAAEGSSTSHNCNG